MTTYRPCLHCHRKSNCPEKKAKQKAVRGAGLTLVDFRCTIPFQDFRPGERVSANLHDYVDRGDTEFPVFEPYSVTLSGTVLRWKPGTRKVLVQFDEAIGTARGDKEIRIIAMWPDRLTKLDEAPRELCACGFGQNADGDCDLPYGFICYDRPVTADPEEMYGPPPSAVAAVKLNKQVLDECEGNQP